MTSSAPSKPDYFNGLHPKRILGRFHGPFILDMNGRDLRSSLALNQSLKSSINMD